MNLGKPSENHQLCMLTLLRVLNSYVRNPSASISIERREWSKFFALRRFRKLGYTKYYARQLMPAGAFAPDWADLWNIRRLVLENTPNRIMEIGGGCSTLMFLLALEENISTGKTDDAACLISYDESDYWQKAMIDYVPQHLRKRLKASVVVPRIQHVNGLDVSVIGVTYPKDIDLLYVDGGLAKGNKVGADALFIEQLSSGLSILVDGRAPTVKFLRDNLRRRYSIQTDPINHWTLFQPA